MQILKKSLLAYLVTLVLFVVPSTNAQQSEPKNILVLFSFRPTLPVASKWDRGIGSIFKAEPNLKVDINIEYLDLSRFNDPNYIKMISSVFRYKHFESKPDLIIAVYVPALDFLLRHQGDLFPGVPIVFGGVERVFIENQGNIPDITGVFQGNSFIKTLETALNLHPNTRHIRIFVGAGMLEQSWAMAARKAYVRYEDQYDFVYVPAQSIEDLQKKVAELPPNTLILYLPIIKDGSGKTHFAIEVISRISEVSTAPIYGFWEVILGHGIVGGDLSSFEEQAKAVAKIGVRILKGARASDIPPIETPGLRYMFDWQQLRRWSISEDRLPPGSTVMFKESSSWEKYKGRIIGAFALIVLQALIIFYLLHQRRVKQKAEQSYRTVADYTYDWEYWVKTDGSLEYVSPSCERISGYSVQDFKKNPELFGEIVVHEDKGRWEGHNVKVEKDLKPGELQLRIQRKDGEIRWIEHVCQPVKDPQGVFLGFRASNRDITERKQAELNALRHRAELTHVSRIATLGELSAAMAHELNQPLTAILGNAQAARRFLSEGVTDLDEVKEILNDIIDDDKRAAEIIKGLRTLMRRKDLEFTSLNLNNLIRRFAEFFNRESFTKNVPLVLELAEDLPNVKGDVVHLEQVILNLILNAAEAMETVDRQSRELKILTVKHDETSVRVSVRDKGPGIDEALIKPIFEAFFTTKPEGMGMGLSICKSIIETHGGRLWVENNPDRGAIVSFTLPIPTGNEA